MAGLGNARQGMHHRVVGHGGIAGHFPGQLDRLGQGLAGTHQILRKADAFAFFSPVNPSGEHHVGHACDTDQTRNAHRSAATHKNATLPLGQCIKRRGLGHAHMRTAGQLKPAADHCAMQRGHDGYPTILNAIKNPVPHARMFGTICRIQVLQLGKIQPGAKVIAIAGQHDGAHILGQTVDAGTQFVHQRVGQGIALGRAVELDDGDLAITRDLQIGLRSGHGRDFARRKLPPVNRYLAGEPLQERLSVASGTALTDLR